MGKTRKNILLILLLAALAVSTVLLAYLYFFRGRDLSGEWTTELDFTEEAAVEAYAWLQEIEAVSVSREELELSMQELTVPVILTLEQGAGAEGTFRSSIPQETYEACRQRAYEAMAAAFRELLSERLQLAGYTGGTNQEAVEALAQEAFGMSTEDYLMTCGPTLLPTLEELQAEYEGSGDYRISEGILTRQYETEAGIVTRRERYIRQGDRLILTEKVDSEEGSGEKFAGSLSALYPVLYILEDDSE